MEAERPSSGSNPRQGASTFTAPRVCTGFRSGQVAAELEKRATSVLGRWRMRHAVRSAVTRGRTACLIADTGRGEASPQACQCTEPGHLTGPVTGFKYTQPEHLPGSHRVTCRPHGHDVQAVTMFKMAMMTRNDSYGAWGCDPSRPLAGWPAANYAMMLGSCSWATIQRPGPAV